LGFGVWGLGFGVMGFGFQKGWRLVMVGAVEVQVRV